MLSLQRLRKLAAHATATILRRPKKTADADAPPQPLPHDPRDDLYGAGGPPIHN
jgi:hypothetical protein